MTLLAIALGVCVGLLAAACFVLWAVCTAPPRLPW